MNSWVDEPRFQGLADTWVDMCEIIHYSSKMLLCFATHIKSITEEKGLNQYYPKKSTAIRDTMLSLPRSVVIVLIGYMWVLTATKQRPDDLLNVI